MKALATLREDEVVALDCRTSLSHQLDEQQLLVPMVALALVELQKAPLALAEKRVLALAAYQGTALQVQTPALAELLEAMALLEAVALLVLTEAVVRACLVEVWQERQAEEAKDCLPQEAEQDALKA